MTDVDFNKFYDDQAGAGRKESNHSVWIGLEEHTQLKGRVDVNYMPATTRVGEPSYMRQHMKYTYVQKESGGEWSRVEEECVRLSSGGEFPEEERPVRMLVFAVAPKAEEYGMAYNAITPTRHRSRRHYDA